MFAEPIDAGGVRKPVVVSLHANPLATCATTVLALLVAGWPVLRWYGLRLGDGSDEPWGLAALALALLFAPWRGWREPLPAVRRMWLCAALAVYALAFPWAPPLVRALLFVVFLGLTAPVRGFAIAWGSLLVLSLPVVATLQFYLGYPLRLVTAHLSVPLIALGGRTAEASGTTLRWAGERVIVDAPCSGIHMLWTGLLVAAALACRHRLDTRKTFQLFRATSLVVFAANLLRATALFFTETASKKPPAWSHAGIGLAFFAGSAVVVFFMAERLGRRNTGTSTASAPNQGTALPSTPALLRPTAVFFALTLLAAAAPAWSGRSFSPTADSASAFPGWSVAPLPISSSWTQQALGPREARFAKDFPGEIGVFTDGERTWVLRWLNQPTRRLHPAADCLRALGYTIAPHPIHQKADHTLWGSTDATLGTEHLRIHERIVGADGRSWTDVSAWFWQASFGRASGPWRAVTEIERGP